MFQCGEFSTITTKPLSGKYGGNNKRQQRKLVSCGGGCVESILLLLVLFLFLSIQCIGLAHGGQVSPSSVTGLGKAISSSSTSSGKDGGASRSSVAALDDSESHHQHNYHRHHRHGSSGKTLPQHSSSSVSTSASYGYQDYGPLSYYNSADIYVEPRYYDRPSREFSARSTSYPAMAAAASTSQVGFAEPRLEPEFGGLALATGHGGGHGGHGHQHGHGHGHGDGGYGHGHHTTYHKTINKLDQSSLGLLGLLGLLSLLSNVLMLLTTTAGTTMMSMTRELKTRPKRDTMMLVKLKDDGNGDLSRKSVVERLSRLILPSLNVVGHAKDGRIPLNCTYQEVCKTNKALVQVFGADEGRPVASVLSTAITNLLANDNRGGRYSTNPRQGHHGSNGTRHKIGNKTSRPLLIVERMLKEAGLAGRNGEDCELTYPTCSALSDTDDYSMNGVKQSESFRLPYLVSPEHALAIIMGQKDG